MNTNWPTDDSSCSLLYDDVSEADLDVEARNSSQDLDRPARGNGLLAIDDSDFEALIEILGTDGDRVNSIARQEAANRSPAERRPSQECRPNDNTPPVARDVHSSGGVAPAGEAVHESPRSSPIVSREPLSPNHQAPNRATIPPGSRLPNRMLQSSPIDRIGRPPPRSSNLSSSGTAELNRDQSSRPRVDPGFAESKQQLGTSLAGAKDQLADLRIRLQVLKGEVKEFAPHLYSRAFDASDPDQRQPVSANGPFPERRQQPNVKGKGKTVPHTSSLNGDARESEDVISSLSEKEAKNALANICHILRIHPSELTSPSRDMSCDPPVPPCNLPDVLRAMKLVSDLDDLVWRRNMDTHDYQPGPSRNRSSRNIYNAENIQSILDRVRLWERTARSRAGRRTGH